jgi:hypothetical protein
MDTRRSITAPVELHEDCEKFIGYTTRPQMVDASLNGLEERLWHTPDRIHDNVCIPPLVLYSMLKICAAEMRSQNEHEKPKYTHHLINRFPLYVMVLVSHTRSTSLENLTLLQRFSGDTVACRFWLLTTDVAVPLQRSTAYFAIHHVRQLAVHAPLTVSASHSPPSFIPLSPILLLLPNINRQLLFHNPYFQPRIVLPSACILKVTLLAHHNACFDVSVHPSLDQHIC